MPDTLRESLFTELQSVRLIDPHSHVEGLTPASTTLADLLGYHYYTELAHSAGMPKDQIEPPQSSGGDVDPRECVSRLVANLGPLRNTVQYSWMLDICQEFFGLAPGEDLTTGNWESVYDAAEKAMASPGWAGQVIEASGLDGVFMTNAFDEPLEGYDTSFYIPCLRTDDLVFKLHEPEVQQRLAAATGVDVKDAATLRDAIGKLFEKFVARGARACAISLPPGFAPVRNSGDTIGATLAGRASDAASHFVFWTLAEQCEQHNLPFDLMIGVVRGVYEAGVYQGQDLFDSRVSLVQYRELFNAFPKVTFPVSVLASSVNQELVSYAWILPNVITNGHWWYSNTPPYIEADLAARLEAVPSTKQIGYYSDAYKLEFILPKFKMYRRLLAKVLAERFVGERGWSEERAIELGKALLRGNVDRHFPG